MQSVTCVLQILDETCIVLVYSTLKCPHKTLLKQIILLIPQGEMLDTLQSELYFPLAL